MPGIYDRSMFRMANGGMMPPMEGDMMEDMPLMSPEQEAQIYQEAQGLPPEVVQTAESELGDLTNEMAAAEVGAAVDEEVSRSIGNMDMAGDFKDIMNSVWDEDEGLDLPRPFSGSCRSGRCSENA